MKIILTNKVVVYSFVELIIFSIKKSYRIHVCNHKLVHVLFLHQTYCEILISLTILPYHPPQCTKSSRLLILLCEDMLFYYVAL